MARRPAQVKAPLQQVDRLLCPAQPGIGVGEVVRGARLAPRVAGLAAEGQRLLEAADAFTVAGDPQALTQVDQYPGLAPTVPHVAGTVQREAMGGDEIGPVAPGPED